MSSGPRGTYICLGAGGLRYRHRLDGKKRRRSAVNRRSSLTVPDNGPARTIESVVPEQIVESSGDELLEEIRRKLGKSSVASFSIALILIGCCLRLAPASSTGTSR